MNSQEKRVVREFQREFKVKLEDMKKELIYIEKVFDEKCEDLLK